MARAGKLKLMGGRMVSAKSKTGDPACSQAASAWQNSLRGNPVGMALSTAMQVLAQCRAKARALKQAGGHRSAGSELRAQALESRVARGGPLTAKDRLARARELRAKRQADIMNPNSPRNNRVFEASLAKQKARTAAARKATLMEKQAIKDYGHNPALAEAGFAAAKRVRAEAGIKPKGSPAKSVQPQPPKSQPRSQQIFAGPPKREQKADRATRLADAREGIKVRAANRAYDMMKEKGLPALQRVRGSEYRNAQAQFLKSGRAALRRATPDANRRIAEQNKLAESRIPDRFPLFEKNPAVARARELRARRAAAVPAASPSPSLREQAAKHRAGKGTREQRVAAITKKVRAAEKFAGGKHSGPISSSDSIAARHAIAQEHYANQARAKAAKEQARVAAARKAREAADPVYRRRAEANRRLDQQIAREKSRREAARQTSGAATEGSQQVMARSLEAERLRNVRSKLQSMGRRDYSKFPTGKVKSVLGAVRNRAAVSPAPLHEQAMEAARRVPSEKRFGSKVFVHHAWQEYRKGGGKLGLSEFKSQLVSTPEARMQMSRADLVQGMRRGDVKGSKVPYMGGEYNFIKVGEAGSGRVGDKIRPRPESAYYGKPPAAEKSRAADVVARARAIRAPKVPSLKEQVAAARAGRTYRDTAGISHAMTAEHRAQRAGYLRDLRREAMGKAKVATYLNDTQDIKFRLGVAMSEMPAASKYGKAYGSRGNLAAVRYKASLRAPKVSGLKEQAAAHRAGKGTAAERAKAIAGKLNRKYGRAVKSEEKIGKELDAATRARTAADARGEDVSKHRERERAIIARAQKYTKVKNRLMSHKSTFDRVLRAAAAQR